MTIVLGFLAGLLTLINPCVLPILPIVLASSLHRHRLAPVALAAGMGVSFVGLGLAVTAAGPALGLDADGLSRAAALVMAGFGLVMLVPAFGSAFATATAGIAARADAGIDRTGDGLAGQALGGVLLGAVWSPCIGPTLGAAIALASTGTGLWQAAAVMTAFAAGVATLVLALAYGAKATLARRRDLLRRLADRSKPILGAMFLLTGLALWFGLHHRIEAWAVRVLPPWLIDLSVSL